MAFLENNLPDTHKPPPGYGRAGLSGYGLGDSRQSLIPLLTPQQQAQLAAQQQAAVPPVAPQQAVIPYALCDAQARAAALAQAQAHGGCVDVAICDNSGRIMGQPTRKCFEDPAVKAALVNQIKADEIEAGALERMVEMASTPDANSPENQASVEAEAAALRDEAAELQRSIREEEAVLAILGTAKLHLATQRDLARSRRASLS